MSERAVIFGCEGDELLGVLHQPKSSSAVPPKRAVLIIVGGPQYRVGSHRQFVLTARTLALSGYPVFRFDYRGMGDSSGAVRSFEQAADDVRAALDALFREQPSVQSVCVFGLCDAASAALIFCTTDPRVDSLVLANPWVRTDAGQAKAVIKHYYGRRVFQKSLWKKLLSGDLNPLAAFNGLLESWSQSRSAGTQVEEGFIVRMLRGMQLFQRPVLLLMSERDLTAREFEELCRVEGAWKTAVQTERVMRVSLSGTDHTFSDEQGLIAANAAILEFMQSGIVRK